MTSLTKFKNFVTKAFTNKGNINNTKVNINITHKDDPKSKDDIKMIKESCLSILEGVQVLAKSISTQTLPSGSTFSSFSYSTPNENQWKKLECDFFKLETVNISLIAQLETKDDVFKQNDESSKENEALQNRISKIEKTGTVSPKSQEENLVNRDYELNLLKVHIIELETRLDDLQRENYLLKQELKPLKENANNYQIGPEMVTDQINYLKSRKVTTEAEQDIYTNVLLAPKLRTVSVRKRLEYFENLKRDSIKVKDTTKFFCGNETLPHVSSSPHHTFGYKCLN